MMNPKPIRIAQVGAGHDHATAAFASMRKQTDQFDLIGIAEPDAAFAGRLRGGPYSGAAVYTVEQLLDMNLDAVAVETAEEDATRTAQLFADRGVAVYMDKPGSPDIAAFDRLADTLERQHLAFQVGYMYRFNPEIRRAMAMIAAGELGEIYSVEAHMSVHHDPAKRAWLGKYPGGMMYFLGCHLIDLVYRIQGAPMRVRAMNCATGAEGVDAPDYGFAVLEYPHGVSIVKSCAREVNGFDRRQLVICGSKGTVELRPLERHDGHGCETTGVRTARIGGTETRMSAPFDRYDGMMRTFAQIVRGERVNGFDYDYERQLFHLVMRCCGAEQEGI